MNENNQRLQRMDGQDVAENSEHLADFKSHLVIYNN